MVGHPVRRRIISLLMLLRSAGLVTAASTLMLSFIDVPARTNGFLRFAVLLAGLLALWGFARSVIIDRWLSRVISRALKRYAEIDVRDYAGLLHLAGAYAIMELQLKEGSWLAERKLEQLGLPEEGVLVLGVVRKDGTYIGAPRGGTRLKTGDTVLLYGRSPILANLDRRPAHDESAHHAAVSEQRRVEQQEAAERG